MKISIIIPVYNVEKSIFKCVNSVLSQNFKDFELILVDDGSTDKSSVICDEYTMKDIRVSVMHKYNEGLSCAIRDGIKKAKGDYITIIDSDDFVDKYYLERMYNAAIMNDCDLVFCDYVKHDGTRNIRTHISSLESGRCEKDKIQKIIIPSMFNNGDNNYVPVIDTNHWAKLFKAEVLKSALRFYKKNQITDISKLLTVSTLTISNRITYLKNEYLYYYRLSPVLFDTDYYEKSIEYYNNISMILNKNFELSKELYYMKINIFVDSIKHQKKYIDTVSKRRIINRFKGINASEFYKSFVANKEYALSKEQKLFLFLLKHNMFRCIYYLIKYKK